MEPLQRRLYFLEQTKLLGCGDQTEPDILYHT